MTALTIVVPIGTSVTAGSGLTTYSGLYTSIQTWLNREDLGPLIPDLMTLVEDRLNRVCRLPDMEAGDTLVAAEEVDLPEDFLELRNLYLTTDPLQPLEAMSPHELRHFWAGSASGKPQNYALRNGVLMLGPTPDSAYDIALDYFQKITPLSADNETNWVSLNHPSCYLFGSLVFAELYGWNDSRLPMLKSAWDEVIAEMIEHGSRKRYGAGPLRMRTTVVE